MTELEFGKPRDNNRRVEYRFEERDIIVRHIYQDLYWWFTESVLLYLIAKPNCPEQFSFIWRWLLLYHLHTAWTASLLVSTPKLSPTPNVVFETFIEQLSFPRHACKTRNVFRKWTTSTGCCLAVRFSVLIWSTFSTADKLLLASTLPLWNEPQVLPCGSPKLANWISEMVLRPPLHDNSNVVPSYAFPHIVSVAVIWKETSEGFPPISSNKINVFEPLLRNDLGTWYLITQYHPLNTWS